MPRQLIFIAVISLLCILMILPASARLGSDRASKSLGQDVERILVVDGSTVHNVGNLNLHIGNWGMTGSWPNSAMPFSDAPSAEWPSGSGIEHLFGAGLWVGAIKNGVPSVSTSMWAFEFRPTDSPVDIIYRSMEGARGGSRLPMPNADDDADGLLDEDWLNGRDDDMDGTIDEDYAGISDQMFSCWYTDNQPGVTDIYPDHNPLDLMVRQESYQWSDPEYDDFVGIEYTITNIGDESLEDVYIAYFVDPDIGNRHMNNYWKDDATGFLSTTVCNETGGYDIDVAYAYDYDADNGQAPGYLGVQLLGHTTGPETPDLLPGRVEITTYANFFGAQSYEEGGDPTNDFERYELMSSQTIERDGDTPADWRYLISVGPFDHLSPGYSVVFQIALVVGDGLDGMLENAVKAKRVFQGEWFDVDGDPLTGVDGRETRVDGPVENVVEDRCLGTQPIPFVPRGDFVYINHDCEHEDHIMTTCGFTAAEYMLYQTGIDGKESHTPWWIPGTAVAPQVSLDIKPGSCTNPFNLNPFTKDRGNGNPNRGGKLPVAIAGGAGLDVHEIDVSTVLLEGVAPHNHSYDDVTSPAPGVCECPEEGPDGYTDLKMNFSRSALAQALGDAENGTVEMRITGMFDDGESFEGVDCVVIVHGRDEPGFPPDPEIDPVTLSQAKPNPFNPTTRITYTLPQSGHVSIAVFDVKGTLVKRLVNGVRPAGEHDVIFEAATLPSGIYFYRLETGGVVETQKLVLLK